MFKSCALALVTTLSLALTSIASANPAVYGKWASVQNIGDTTFTLTLAIQEKQSGLSVTCSKAGKSTTASITVPTEVTATQLIIKGSASDEKKLGDVDCNVEISPMEFDYNLANSDLLQLTAQGQTVDFSRIK
jgi:hypothetical protein